MTPRTLIIAALSAAAAFAAGSALLVSTAPDSTATTQEIVGLDLSGLTPPLDGQVWTVPSAPAAYWDDDDDDDDHDDHERKESKKAKDHDDRHHGDDDDDDDDDHHDHKSDNRQYEDAKLSSAWLNAFVSL